MNEIKNRHDYAEGLTNGYGQGAGATAEAIANRIHSIVASGESVNRDTLVRLLRELEKDYELDGVREVPPSPKLAY